MGGAILPWMEYLKGLPEETFKPSLEDKKELTKRGRKEDCSLVSPLLPFFFLPKGHKSEVTEAGRALACCRN